MRLTRTDVGMCRAVAVGDETIIDALNGQPIAAGGRLVAARW